jgi:putative nucleotidyltransferase-like protein
MRQAAGPTSDPILSLLSGGGTLPAPADPLWDDTARRLVKEGLSGVALTELARRDALKDLTPGARSLLESDLNAVRASHAILFERFTALASLLAEAGVPFLVHKGGALAPLLYARIEDRPMVDIDIIFPPSLWRRVREALATGGYRIPEGAREAFWLENYFNLSVSSPVDPPSSFDLHWSLTQEGRYHIETDDLFSRAVPYEMGGARLMRLGDEDFLLSLFLHLAYHYFEARLLWLYDMKLVLTRWSIDWDRLLARAGAWGLSTVVALNVAFLEKVLPGTIPPAAAARCRTGGIRRALLRPFLSPLPTHLFRNEENRLNQFALGLMAIDRPSDSLRFAADKVARSVRWAGRRPRRR